MSDNGATPGVTTTTFADPSPAAPHNQRCPRLRARPKFLGEPQKANRRFPDNLPPPPSPPAHYTPPVALPLPAVQRFMIAHERLLSPGRTLATKPFSETVDGQKGRTPVQSHPFRAQASDACFVSTCPPSPPSNVAPPMTFSISGVRLFCPFGGGFLVAISPTLGRGEGGRPSQALAGVVARGMCLRLQVFDLFVHVRFPTAHVTLPLWGHD